MFWEALCLTTFEYDTSLFCPAISQLWVIPLQISLDGKVISQQHPKQLYFALNKPKGYICSNTASKHEQQTPRLVVDLFSDWLKRLDRKGSSSKALPPRLFTVGRLDVQSSGLVFVTNDGESTVVLSKSAVQHSSVLPI